MKIETQIREYQPDDAGTNKSLGNTDYYCIGPLSM
jgi:hypothetical protein